ncbi:MAG: sel1 repeat family protein [Magnetococcales bacterium]|nr:sel1 repeat family protein [Magnetococcales bacterium]MBF0150140.1 sel1 repeat family protein [Magnetococcales bacterium]MBF0172169.1 sel1 repeat family protein [Magnetococcales bacterium]MBF0347151.1 sel1 repeat family protein [Magnetococcales bacterium]MBF0630532.1 sel1 repeat family protein [Magnetococcales bacterium]
MAESTNTQSAPVHGISGSPGFHELDQGDYVATLTTFAQWGDPKAQHDLAAIYLEGREVEQDFVEALKWHTLAAEQGNVLSQHDLATMYLEGLGVAPDPEKAFAWFSKAAQQGDGKARNNLGILYATGQGVALDLVEAAKWFILARDQGTLDAVENLEIAREEMTPEQFQEAVQRAKQELEKT